MARYDFQIFSILVDATEPVIESANRIVISDVYTQTTKCYRLAEV